MILRIFVTVMKILIKPQMNTMDSACCQVKPRCKAHGIDKECVQAHARCLRIRYVGDQSHDQRTDDRGNDRCEENSSPLHPGTETQQCWD